MTDNYRHRKADGGTFDLPVGKIVCVGRNYTAHARELNNPVPTTPLLFIKPATALVSLDAPFCIPTDRGAVHHELELALLLGKQLDAHSTGQATEAIAGIGLALDLTLRDVQTQLKNNGQPWEIAKGFDGACPCSAFVPTTNFPELQDIEFQLCVNDELRQEGTTRDMLFPIGILLEQMSRHFTLLPGDIVLTGTPEGVSALHSGDKLRLSLADQIQIDTHVVD